MENKELFSAIFNLALMVFIWVMWFRLMFFFMKKMKQQQKQQLEEKKDKELNYFQQNAGKSCPPHAWEWIQGRGHKCRMCGMSASEDSRE